MTKNQPIVHIAGYRFIPLDDLAHTREVLKAKCKQFKLKGTILLSSEGINIMLAGTGEDISRFRAYLQTDPRFKGIQYKINRCDEMPFAKLYIKLKKEIISMGCEEIEPYKKTGKRISPQELKALYEQHPNDFVIVDTRNDYEVAVGSFDNAIELPLKTFREFPKIIKQVRDELKNKKVITFCTGGVRCEKATPLMENLGIEDVYQLDGGILAYFEQCGGEHYHGDCYVFDERVAVNSKLEAVPHRLCSNCQAHLGIEEHRRPLKEKVYCHACQTLLLDASINPINSTKETLCKT